MSTVLITGATDGLGRYVATELAKAGHRVIAHGRNPSRLERLRDQLGARLETVQADLAELRQVDRLADEIRKTYDRLDVLVNNAGIGAGADRRMREESADGIELRFAVNYLAGYHLARRLVPLLADSAPSRVVNVASVGQRPIDFADPLLASSYDGMRAYQQSKLAQIMFTMDLAGELADDGVTVNALHPATLMPTTMVEEGWPGGAMSTLEEGGAATLRLITAPELAEVTGEYFNSNDPEPARANPQAYDADARHELRELSDRLIASALEG
ncbi:SDR family NAD(P)-dependent oxidoreductase [Phytoactinopolyspora halotolerans]|uniref:SDR family NAD(P)-dependent oxidoreductase n=1 Tax=Phytoactinopolyspora halotolerans TaxID=1981512 RepID=A0A6L9SCM2_9ACTN|nr:SDR family NAD(P)-dependent oxidoreductase [Phytoactinopolyspora halotolerans]NEE02817.1 SDR family NAD(P)-dependent oxidoreductase [Phytoactinopolyspora halotolerans]